MQHAIQKAKQVIIPFYNGSKRFKNSILLVFTGLPGAGKSSIARTIAKHYPFYYASADNVRVALHPHPQHTSEEDYRTYQVLYSMAEKLLEQKKCVIIDATMPLKKHRKEIYDLFHAKSTVMLLFVHSSKHLIKERFLKRKKNFKDPTQIVFDGDPDILKKFEDFEKPADTEADHFFQIENKDSDALEDELEPLYTVLDSYLQS